MKYLSVLLAALFAVILISCAFAQDSDYDAMLKEYREKYPGMAFSDSDIVLYSPVNYQVFQRRSKSEGEIFFSGRINVPWDKVSYRITGRGFDGRPSPKVSGP